MEINIYRLTSKDLPGYIYLVYENGILRQVLNELREPVDNELWDATRIMFPQKEDNDFFKGLINGISNFKFQISLIPQKTIQQKIITFSAWYKAHRGISYIAKDTEKANLKQIPVTDPLLKAFFTSGAWFVQNNYTLSNYITRINLLKDYVKNGPDTKSKYPDQYEATFEAKCTPDELTGYWAHLRSIGYKKEGNRWVRS